MPDSAWLAASITWIVWSDQPTACRISDDFQYTTPFTPRPTVSITAKLRPSFWGIEMLSNMPMMKPSPDRTGGARK